MNLQALLKEKAAANSTASMSVFKPTGKEHRVAIVPPQGDEFPLGLYSRISFNGDKTYFTLPIAKLKVSDDLDLTQTGNWYQKLISPLWNSNQALYRELKLQENLRLFVVELDSDDNVIPHEDGSKIQMFMPAPGFAKQIVGEIFENNIQISLEESPILHIRKTKASNGFNNYNTSTFEGSVNLSTLIDELKSFSIVKTASQKEIEIALHNYLSPKGVMLDYQTLAVKKAAPAPIEENNEEKSMDEFEKSLIESMNE